MLKVDDYFCADGENWLISRFLGKGKSGYSYLIEHNGEKRVLKMIHDEACPYYNFTDKFSAEITSYNKLIELNIPLPRLTGFNEQRKYLIKEYIDGPTASELIAACRIEDIHISQLFKIFNTLKYNQINIDYFPSNFVISHSKLYYIDYEMNPYLSEWDLVNWGIYYWANFEGMKRFLETGDSTAINARPEKGISHKDICKSRVEDWINHFLCR